MFPAQLQRPIPSLLFALLLSLASGVQGQEAATPVQQEAATPVKGEVFVILAKEDPGHVDPKLKAIRALQKPPFNAFRSMQVLSNAAITLSGDRPVTTELPNGRHLRLTLVERMPDGRHKIAVSINRPNKKDYLPLLTVIASGEPFFVAGQKFQGGTLVIGVKVGAGKPARRPDPPAK